MKPVRKSVPTEGAHKWWGCGWMYIMPDFDKKDHSIIEWCSEREPTEPNLNPANEASDVERAE